MKLEIGIKQLKFIENQGEIGYPSECCGLMAGHKNGESWVVKKVIPLKNEQIESSNKAYKMNPKERNQAEMALEREGLNLVGFYHSHPDHEAYFSKTDLENSEEFQFGEPWMAPAYAYWVVSVKKGQSGAYRAFIIKEGHSEEIEIKLITEEAVK